MRWIHTSWASSSSLATAAPEPPSLAGRCARALPERPGCPPHRTMVPPPRALVAARSSPWCRTWRRRAVAVAGTPACARPRHEWVPSRAARRRCAPGKVARTSGEGAGPAPHILRPAALALVGTSPSRRSLVVAASLDAVAGEKG